MLGTKFDFKLFGNFQKSLKSYASETNTLPSEIQKVYEASDVPFGYNEDAELINSVLWKVDDYNFWREPAFSPKTCTLFSKKVFEKKQEGNPVNTRSCEIIYAFSKRPIAETKKECRELDIDLILNSPLTGLDANFNAFLEEEKWTEYRRGDVHGKTDEIMLPVPVGYIVRDTTSWYRKEQYANQPPCQAGYCLDKEKILETYCILDFVLEGLKESVGEHAVRRLSKANQRLFVVPTGNPEIQ